jgi:hypothetical protein
VCGWGWIRKQVNMPELSNISHVDYEKSHDKAENKVNGNKRIEDGSGTDIFKDNGTKTSQTISPTASGSVTITKLLSLINEKKPLLINYIDTFFLLFHKGEASKC